MCREIKAKTVKYSRRKRVRRTSAIMYAEQFFSANFDNYWYKHTCDIKKLYKNGGTIYIIENDSGPVEVKDRDYIISLTDGSVHMPIREKDYKVQFREYGREVDV